MNYFTLKNGQKTWTEFTALWRRFWGGIQKMSIDSESNKLTNLSSSSDEDILKEDVEEIHG